MNLKDFQRYAKDAGLYAGKLDGDDGPKTIAATSAYLLKARAKDWQDWPRARQIIGALQAVCADLGIEVGEIDGMVGPQTRFAFEVFDARAAKGNLEKVVPAVETWRDKEKPLPPVRGNPWPRQADVTKFFGPVGANQATLVFPYPMRLAWATKTIVTKTSCHEKVHDAAGRVLARVFSHYGDDVAKLGLDLFGGCLNVRKMRGGSAWSMHSWGIAFDFDPEHNQLKQSHATATFAKPEYEKWWQLWGEEGFVSLGRARDYDWMHVQAARL